MGEEQVFKAISDRNELDLYKLAFESSMKMFSISKNFPSEERYALTDQIRRSSRSVCANISEAWRKRRYQKSFLLSLNNAEAEAAETQTWIKFAAQCGYLGETDSKNLNQKSPRILLRGAQPASCLMAKRLVFLEKFTQRYLETGE